MKVFFTPYILCIFMVLIIFLTYAFVFLAPESYLMIVDEGHIVETLTAIIFGITTVGCLIAAYHHKKMLWWVLSYFMAFATFRELDLHKAFTHDSILKSNFYKNPDYPIIEKIFGIVFILILIGFIGITLKNIKAWLTFLRAKNHIAWTIFLGIGMIIFAKTLDSSARLFPFLAGHIAALKAPKVLIEESFECAAAMVFLYIPLYALLSITNNNRINQ